MELISATEEAKRVVIKECNETAKYEETLKSEKDQLVKDNEVIIKAKDLEFWRTEKEAKLNYERQLNNINNDMSQEALMKVLYKEMGRSMESMNFEKIQWLSMRRQLSYGSTSKNYCRDCFNTAKPWYC